MSLRVARIIHTIFGKFRSDEILKRIWAKKLFAEQAAERCGGHYIFLFSWLWVFLSCVIALPAFGGLAI